MSDPREKLPPGAIVNTEVVVFQYLDPSDEDCSLKYCVWYDGEVALSSVLGLLELAKRDLIDRSFA